MPCKKKEQPPTFEEALEELESMVDTMESDHLPLEKLITSYERGAELISHCEKVLGNARKRLELITLHPQSPPEESPKNPTQKPSPDTQDLNDDEIRLF